MSYFKHIYTASPDELPTGRGLFIYICVTVPEKAQTAGLL